MSRDPHEANGIAHSDMKITTPLHPLNGFHEKPMGNKVAPTPDPKWDSLTEKACVYWTSEWQPTTTEGEARKQSHWGSLYPFERSSHCEGVGKERGI